MGANIKVNTQDSRVTQLLIKRKYRAYQRVTLKIWQHTLS